jgi:small subunit ribosomal protein S4
MHGQQARWRRKESDYGLQLREKQKARRIYGVLERQFRRYFKEAERRKGLTGVNLLIILESRLDSVVYRLGFADSRAQARQLVRHGHFDVNGRKTDIPSFLVKTGDVITVRERSKKLAYFRDLSTVMEHKVVPEWLSLDISKMEGRVVASPTREDIDASLNEQLIVGYYSR